MRNNIIRLAALLQDPTIWGLPAGNCTVVDQPESADAMMKPVVAASAAAQDTLLLYYGGHGILRLTSTMDRYLSTPGASAEQVWSALAYEHVRHQMLLSQARRKIVILDCCFSGQALRGAMASRARLARFIMQATADTTPGAIAILTATAETTPALAPEGAQFTAFSGQLIRLLEHGVPNDSPLLDMASIHLHLSRSLRRLSYPEPQLALRNDGASIAVARNRAFHPSLPSAPEHVSRAARPSTRALRAALVLALPLLLLTGPPIPTKEAPAAASRSTTPLLPVVAAFDAGLPARLRGTFDAQMTQNTLFTATDADGAVIVTATSTVTGRRTWRASIPVKDDKGKRPNHTLIVHDNLVLAQFTREMTELAPARSDLVVLSGSDGRLLWRRSGATAFLPLKDSLGIVQFGNGEEAHWHFVDEHTGQTIWRSGAVIMRPVTNRDSTHSPMAEGALNPDPATFFEWTGAGSSRVWEQDTQLRIRDAATGKVLNRPPVPEITGPLDWTVTVVGDRVILTRIPEDEAGDTANATLTAYDARNGRRQWQIRMPFRPQAGYVPTFHVCGTDLICAAQPVSRERTRFVAFRTTTGRRLWSSDVNEELRSDGFFYLGPGYRDETIAMVTTRRTGFNDVLILDARTGTVRQIEHEVVPLPLTDRLVLLRGHLEGPELGDVSALTINLRTGERRQLGNLTTAAMYCRASQIHLVCPDADRKMRAYRIS
ncbi:hypothetical protein KRM28CT15_42630 [Krasilnikovia sp. M28-CT-15]